MRKAREAAGRWRGPLARLPRRLDPPDSVVSPDTQNAATETNLTQEPVSVEPKHYSRRELAGMFGAAGAGAVAAGFAAHRFTDDGDPYITTRWVDSRSEEFLLNREAATAWAVDVNTRFAPNEVRAVFVQGDTVLAVQLLLRPIERGEDGSPRTVTRRVAGLPPWPVDNWPTKGGG